MKIKLLNPECRPSYANEGDAGLDLRANIPDRMSLWPNMQATIGTGVIAAIPHGYFGLLLPRSGLGTKGIRLLNTAGVIDSKFRGEIMAKIENVGAHPISIEPHDRFVQLLIIPVQHVEIEEADELDETGRTNGFGDSGVK